MYLKKPGGFDISLFYRYISSIAEDEDLRVHFEESSKLEDLLQKVHAKESKKRALSKLKLKLNKDIVISAVIYNLVQKALKSHPIKLYRETNESVKTKTQTFNINTGSLLLPSDTKRSQILWESQIILEKEETQELKWFDNPGLMLMGFKPLEKELDDQKSQVTPPGFQLLFLLFADVKRKMPFTEKVMATPEQVDKMKAIILKLHFSYRSDSFEKPVLHSTSGT
ncbi:X-ray repair cross-complementing protein 6 [Plecturocebus cupreus]